MTATKTIAIDVLANDDDPVLVTNSGATVAAHTSSVTLTSGMLLVTDVDAASNKNITYTVTDEVDTSKGWLVLHNANTNTDQRLAVGSFFTQDDVNNGRVRYEYYGASTAGFTDDFNSRCATLDPRLPDRARGGIYGDATSTAASALTQFTFTIDVAANVTAGDGTGPGGGVVTARARAARRRPSPSTASVPAPARCKARNSRPISTRRA